MECAEYQELNALYALDALDAQGRQALEAHLATCPDCAKDLAALRDTAAAIGYTAPRVAVPTDLKTRLDARIAAESAPPKAPWCPSPAPSAPSAPGRSPQPSWA